MTTKEIYFKAYMNTDKPKGMLFYMRETFIPHLKKKIHQMCCTPWLKFDKDFHESNIKKMTKIENSTGFMFWNIDDKSDTYANEVSKETNMKFHCIAMITKS
jgi:hypothetical protein